MLDLLIEAFDIASACIKYCRGWIYHRVTTMPLLKVVPEYEDRVIYDLFCFVVGGLLLDKTFSIAGIK